MPLVAHNNMPSFARLAKEGSMIIPPDKVAKQNGRDLHIGLLNMMPDSALEATERQFYRLVGESNHIAQFYMHPFTLKELERTPPWQAHIDQYYCDFSEIKTIGLDALIITGANVIGNQLSEQSFWQPLTEIIDWAYENLSSTLCSCLATHIVLEYRYQQKRSCLDTKRWGVYPHRITDRYNALVAGVNTRFDVPHSRFNEISKQQFIQAGLKILVQNENNVHLAVSNDGLKFVFFQGHPEYDSISLLKEYKREISCYILGERDDYPVFPENYFSALNQAILEEFQDRLYHLSPEKQLELMNEFPEELIATKLDNTWHDSAEAVLNNWIGKIYQNLVTTD